MNQLTPFKAALQRHENNLEKCLPKFANVLPSHVEPQKIMQSVMNALSQNQYLATSCDAGSVMQAAMTAAVLGLEVDNVTGQGYITPFKGKAQFITGYKGYITLAMNSGFIVSGEAVREKDKFSYSQGLNPHLDHVPATGSPSERGDIVYTYAIARHNTLPSLFKVVHVEDINKIRDGSEGYKAFMAGKIKSTPWATNYEKMAIKTAIRNLAPQLPLSVQKANAIESAYETGKRSYLNERGDVIIENETQETDKGGSNEQPTAADLGIEDDICGHCHGTGQMDDLIGGKQPCVHCGS
jgi:recombination protein RecT